MDTPNHAPTPPPEDSRPGAATMLTISAADLGDLIGDQAACAHVAQTALMAIAGILETLTKEAKSEKPDLRMIAAGLLAARDGLNAPGLLTERAANGLKAVEKAICAAAEATEGKTMPPPGAAFMDKLIDAIPDKAEPGALGERMAKVLQSKAIALAIQSAPRSAPPAFSGRNGQAWPRSGWNPDAQNN